jgi:hypothetical protein
MKCSALTLAVLLVVGCGDSRPPDENGLASDANVAFQAHAAESASAVVTDFKMPELAGLSVRDHAQGVQVVTPPTGRGSTPPPIGTNDLLWAFAPGAIFTSVNGTSARDAKHFRELMDAIKSGQEVSLGQTLFLEDAGNGMVSIQTSPPERE